MNVALLDLKRQYASLREEIRAELDKILESQYFIGGPAIAELEGKVAEYSKVGHAAGVASGTDAIIAALMAVGVYRSPLDTKPADEVIVPAYTFFATAGAVWRVGARPVFADIDPVTYNIDPSKIEEKITPRTKAIIPVHLYGQCADMKPILAIAKKHNLAVIEDACQSIGARQDGLAAGAFGDCACLSFFPTKNLGGFGDGGMVISKREDLINSVKRIRNHGMEPKYYHASVGGNFRLDTIQAAGLLIKLKRLDEWGKMRRRNADVYYEAFKGSNVQTPHILPQNESIFNQFIVRVANRDAVIAKMKDAGVGCEIYYPVPLHLQECFKPLGYKLGDFPQSELAAKETLALPIYPELAQEELLHVAQTLKAIVG